MIMHTSEEAEVQVTFSNLDNTTSAQDGREASKTAVGAGPQCCRDTVKHHYKVVEQQEGIDGAGGVSETWKKDQSASHLPGRQREGYKVHLHQPYYIVDSAGSRRLD